MNRVVSVGSATSKGASFTCSRKIVQPGIDTLPSALVTGVTVLSNDPLLKLFVVNVDAPPGAMPLVAATEVSRVEPSRVDVPVAVAFTGVSKADVPVESAIGNTSIDDVPVPLSVASLSETEVPVALT